MGKPIFILASSSVYRKKLLERLCIPFSTWAPEVDETPLPGEASSDTAARLAEAKARACKVVAAESLVIGSDQVAMLDDEVLGKPYTFENALRQLRKTRGRAVQFHTGLALWNTAADRMQSRVVSTVVHFRDYTDEEIHAYLKKEQPYHCAGSAQSEGLGIVLIQSIQGDDPTALIGLPLIALVAMLRQESVSVLD